MSFRYILIFAETFVKKIEIKPNSRADVDVGESVTRSCSVSTNTLVRLGKSLLQIRWRKPSTNEILNSTINENTTINSLHTNTFLLENIKTSDAGVYLCESWVGNDAAFLEIKSFNIFVRSKCDFYYALEYNYYYIYIIISLSVPQNISVQRVPFKSIYNTGSSLSLVCTLMLVNHLLDTEGDIVISWKFKSITRLNIICPKSQNVTYCTATLSIKSLDLTDAGKYDCMASIKGFGHDVL